MCLRRHVSLCVNLYKRSNCARDWFVFLGSFEKTEPNKQPDTDNPGSSRSRDST
ncbi:hypothetical protein PROFUN_05375 [Planoprotostelium fungivorum]|uniref:Uncharacterized protein n=1 Tax=Planoprotostelium fungivorum TaxID=1890364 RepID=A0A2P6NR70_9EUKA|nr:hypothetical protein PROFUN_05375 [Planoprotostelium fungivorum]